MPAEPPYATRELSHEPPPAPAAVLGAFSRMRPARAEHVTVIEADPRLPLLALRGVILDALGSARVRRVHVLLRSSSPPPPAV